MKHYEIGDRIKYQHEGVEHEDVIHAVRYEEIDGKRTNVRYLVPEEYIEHEAGDKHKHDTLCPFVEREVPHDAVIAKV